MISEFRGAHFFLSNFYPCIVQYEGHTFLSSESAFQAAKVTPSDTELRQAMALIASPKKAKHFGRQVPLRPDWDEVKLTVMSDILHIKFTEPALRKYLVDTFPHELIEGNWWGDTYWGAVLDGMHHFVGENWLGKLLMRERIRIMAETGYSCRPNPILRCRCSKGTNGCMVQHEQLDDRPRDAYAATAQ